MEQGPNRSHLETSELLDKLNKGLQEQDINAEDQGVITKPIEDILTIINLTKGHISYAEEDSDEIIKLTEELHLDCCDAHEIVEEIITSKDFIQEILEVSKENSEERGGKKRLKIDQLKDTFREFK